MSLPRSAGRGILGPGALLLVLAAGCSSGLNREKFYAPLEADLRSGNYAAAVATVEEARSKGAYKEKDRFLYYLDAGLAYHYASQFDSSNLRLAVAERAAEELFTKSISKGVLANTLLNDNVLEYPGEDYEVLYTNLLMALNYLALGKHDDAFVEIRRAHDKLNLLEQKYADAAAAIAADAARDTTGACVAFAGTDVRFNSSAFARYLSMHMYAAEGLDDDARIDSQALADAFARQPNIYAFPPPPVAYAADSGGVLSVVGLVGLAPVKQPLNLRVRTDENLHLLTVIYDDARPEHTVFANYPLPEGIGDFYAKLSLPQLVPRPSEIAAVRVSSGGRVLGELQLLEDVAAVAAASFEARQSIILWRTVVRVVLKTLSASRLKNAVDNGGIAGWLGKLAADVAYDVSEQADLRSAVLLPGRIFVGDFVVPPGAYDLTVEYLDAEGAVVESRHYPGVSVRERAFNLVRTFCLR
ncbi:MAG TPA: hypothetical protein PLR32_05660 [candidate division Zixibacteria bacterium]|nr:hypothetical protein [candidate division Zixibacteria bacterium]MDD4917549.1 hypothetical protein [candidate division Zixibacteria bacterium]MDM7972182.1 hypothetical protein [candidate division Zixibacteria bacterium]HOD66478.1 hypothetical protein [candidate division Zixibacteria bacterium]HPI32782.1 hypothetical protein [candidate division Zixibacteria bacterium]